MPRASVLTKHKIIARVEADLLKQIRVHEGLSRADVARQLQLAPSTAGIYVDRLKAEGFLLEGEKVDRKLGRRPTLLTPNPAAGRFVGIDFEARSLITVVVDFSLQMVKRTHRAIPEGESAERVLRRIETALETAVAGDKRPLLGIGVGVPGIVDTATGRVSEYEYIPGWKDVPVAQRLSQKFEVPVHVENNIRSMALAEMWLGQGRGLRDFVCLGVRTGIGVGAVVNGHLVTGAHGGGGEIGRWPVTVGAVPTQSLETAASLSAILNAAKAVTGKEFDLAALRNAVETGDRTVREVLERAADLHGAVLYQLYLVFDPSRIILVGPLADLGPVLLLPVTTAVRRRCNGRMPEIVCSNFGQYGGAFGAATLALHRWAPTR